jgi:hypothetical protein
MGKTMLDDTNETESDGYIEAVRVAAKNDWKDARPVSMETTERQAAVGDELVDA